MKGSSLKGRASGAPVRPEEMGCESHAHAKQKESNHPSFAKKKVAGKGPLINLKGSDEPRGTPSPKATS